MGFYDDLQQPRMPEIKSTRNSWPLEMVRQDRLIQNIQLARSFVNQGVVEVEVMPGVLVNTLSHLFTQLENLFVEISPFLSDKLQESFYKIKAGFTDDFFKGIKLYENTQNFNNKYWLNCVNNVLKLHIWLEQQRQVLGMKLPYDKKLSANFKNKSGMTGSIKPVKFKEQVEMD